MVRNVVAEIREQAVENAKQIVENQTAIMAPHNADESGLEFEQCSFVEEANAES